MSTFDELYNFETFPEQMNKFLFILSAMVKFNEEIDCEEISAGRGSSGEICITFGKSVDETSGELAIFFTKEGTWLIEFYNNPSSAEYMWLLGYATRFVSILYTIDETLADSLNHRLRTFIATGKDDTEE